MCSSDLAKRAGVRYFGPYAHAWAIRETLDALLRTLPIRTCSDAKLRRHERLGRPCLSAHLGQCAAPCVDGITPAEYGDLVASLVRFLDGDTDEVVGRLRDEMARASDALEFERAARLRDQLSSIERVEERQTMVGPRDEDLDLLWLVDDELEASVQVFHVRRGRVVGRKGFIVDKVEDLTPAQLVGQILEALYYDEPVTGWPKEVLVPELPDRKSTRLNSSH